MAAKKRGLGKGLSALLGDESKPALASGIYLDHDIKKKPSQKAEGSQAPAQQLPVAFLRPTPLQPRRIFNDVQLKELADSIKESGLLQPILVRPGQKKDRYEIVAGERRWRAAQKAGLHDVPVIIRELTNQDVLQFAIIENIQREDLTPIEEAHGYSRLINDFGHKQEEVAKLVGKSRSHIANLVRLLTLPKDVIKLLDERKLTMGHARALIGSDDPSALARQILKEGMNVRDIEALAGTKKPSGKSSKKTKAVKSADTLALEKNLADRLGLKVDIQHKGKGGKLVIHYKNLDQLDAVCKRLKKSR
jgi:ParB family chromosome partitioning protein